MLKHFKMFGNKKNQLQNPSLQKKFEQKWYLGSDSNSAGFVTLYTRVQFSQIPPG